MSVTRAIFLNYVSHSLAQICKDKTQADSWFIGLRALISRSTHLRLFRTSESGRSAQSCVNSPAGYMRRKQNLGLSEDTTTRISKVCLHHQCFICICRFALTTYEEDISFESLIDGSFLFLFPFTCFVERDYNWIY